MASFCTACGTRNDDGAVYCEACGAPLKAAIAAAASAADRPVLAVPRTTPWSPVVVGSAILALAIVGALGWWVWSAPAAGSEAFAAALRERGEGAGGPSVDLLCLANIAYNRPQIPVGEYDANMRQWMDELVSAGLYAPGRVISGGGGFARKVIQYSPMPQLDSWRRSGRLCIAKSWAVGEVKAAPFAAERFGQREIFRATAVWKAAGRAPWLDKVPDAVSRLRGVRQMGTDLIAESHHGFELRDRRWVALSAADLEQLPRHELTAKGPSGVASAGALDGLKTLIGGLNAASPLAGQSNTPSEATAREFYEKENSAPIEAGVIQIEAFRKTNATKRTVDGLEMYEFEYQAELFFPKGNLPECVDNSRFDTQCFLAQNSGIKFLKLGARITDKGSIIFEKAENGWRAKQLQSNR